MDESLDSDASEETYENQEQLDSSINDVVDNFSPENVSNPPDNHVEMVEKVSEQNKPANDDAVENVWGQSLQSEPPQPSHQAGAAAAEDPDPEHQIGRFNHLAIRRLLNLPRSETVPNFAEYTHDVLQTLSETLERAQSLRRPGDLVQLELRGLVLHTHRVFNADDDADLYAEFQNNLDQLIQSSGEALQDNDLELRVQIVRNPAGGGKRKADKTLDVEIINKKKRHLYVVLNRDDQLCFATCLAYLSEPNLTVSQAAQRGAELQLKAGLSVQTPVKFTDIVKFENMLKRKIVVFQRNKARGIIVPFSTSYPNRDAPLYLFFHGNHYYGVINPQGFLGWGHVCNFCFRGYNDASRHGCKDSCNVCHHASCKGEPSKPIVCNGCHRYCHSTACLRRHKEATFRPLAKVYASRCDVKKRCLKCHYLYDVPLTKKRRHVCRSPKCYICGEKLSLDTEGLGRDHLCYIQPSSPEEPNEKLIFYDFETFTDSNVHVAFLVCTTDFEGKQWSCYGEECIQTFVLKYRKPQHKNTTFLGHNSKGFDSYLILNCMVKMGLKTNVIMQGSKVLWFEDPHYSLRFIDSLSFLTMPLAKIPKAMGVTDQNKGHFPHLFSSREHLEYVGAFPDPDHFDGKRMTPGQQTEFSSWYTEAAKGRFDFKKEALHYCHNDVTILREGCLKFREEFLAETSVDPFRSITIASACMKVFLTKFLQPNELAIVPPDNYRRQSKTFSKMSLQWLEWEADCRRVTIQHALKGGEKQIGKYFVDGYAEIDGKKYAWEFLGCYVHGCPVCYDGKSTNPWLGKTFEQLHYTSNDKLETLKTLHNVELVVMTEHEWKEKVETDPEVKEFLRGFEAPEALSPREALYGGRTSAFRLRYTAAPKETVHYVDVTSLYPYVNSQFPYPLGHPKIIYRDFDDPQTYFGFIKAVVYPPRKLLFPILPHKTTSGKLVFTLCRTCAEINQQDGPCLHDDDARALSGVWVSEELNKALAMGYRLAKITEVWHFEKQSNTIFAEYMRTFLKGKQEASGYPADVVDDESREKYIKDYETHQGIRLDPANIRVNPAKRQMAKLCFNSLWGKFGQRSNLTKTSIVDKPEEFFDLVFSGKKCVKYFNIFNDDFAMVQWTYNDQVVVPPGRTSNVFVAAFTTAHARLSMYGYLERLQDRVLYTDTDSLIYVVKEGETPLELGKYLGQLTDELDGDSIQEFASSGPKSYAYQTRDKKTVVLKAKGIKQTQECCEMVNFDSVRELVEGYLNQTEDKVAPSIEVPQTSIVRDKNKFHLRNVAFRKKLRVVYDKRRLFPDGTTLPFGY